MNTCILTITIDTERDCSPDWSTSNPLTFRSITEGIPEKLQPLFNEYGAKPTYLLSSEVLEDNLSVQTLKKLDGEYELGTHLHAEYIDPQKKFTTYAGTLSSDFQSSYQEEIEHAKMKNLTLLFKEKFGYNPTSFRAGRFGMGENTICSLEKLGYTVDTSVTPHTYWHNSPNPRSYIGFHEQPYFLNNKNIKKAGKSTIMEIPITIYRTWWGRIPFINRFSRFSLWLRPFQFTVSQMYSVIDYYRKKYSAYDNVILNMMFHSMEVIPQASPYPQTDKEVASFLADIRAVLEYCKLKGIQFHTLSETYELWKKKIIQVIPTLQTGGAEKTAVFLTKNISISEKRKSKIVCFFGDGGKLEEELDGSQIIILPEILPVRLIKGWYRRFKKKPSFSQVFDRTSLQLKPTPLYMLREIIQAIRCWCLFKREKPYVVNIHQIHCKFALLAAKAAGIPRVFYTHHNILSLRHTKPEIALLPFCLRYCDKVIAVSNAVKQEFINIGIPSEKIEVIHPPVLDIDEKTKINFKKAGSPLVLGTASNLGPVKGVAYLLEAIQLLNKQTGVDVVLKIAGERGLRDSLESKSYELGIDKYVEFTGAYKGNEGLARFMNQIDIFVLPSLSESWSIVLMEAMFFGKPIIASNTGGIPELIKNEITGILIPPQSPQDIAKAVKWFLEDLSRIGIMGETGHNYWEKHFTKEKIINTYESLYQ
ncbi:MAG: glycosyltransferase [bacterium]|nr:glycosyltransferase [bacterium]